MKKNIPVRLFLLTLLMVYVFGCATTSGVKETSLPQDGAVVTDIKIEDNKITISGSAEFSYTLFSANDPYKITVEIPDMKLGAFTYRIISNRKGVTELVPQQVDEPSAAARFDISLESPSSIVPVYKDNTLTLMVKADESVAMPAETVAVTDKTDDDDIPGSVPEEQKIPQTSEMPQPSPAVPASEITSIAMRKTANAVEIVVTGNGTMIPNVFPLDERIVVDVPDVRLNATLPESMISPLRGIRAGKHRDRVRLVLDLKEKTNFDVSAIGSSIVIALLAREYMAAGTGAPGAEKAAPAMSLAPVIEPEELVEGKYTGKRISLDFQDADIIPIFRLLADVSGYNIVVHPNVKGTTTLKLINVPWDQALDLILRTFSLSKLVDGNIIRIVPTNVVAQELDDIAKKNKAESEAGELRTRIFPVNYADLTKLKDAIDKAKVLSSRGSITLDERGSSIIVNDIEPNLQKIDELIAEIDREQMQARQVMIEAKIVEVNSDYTKDLGIQWGANYSIPRAGDTTTIGGTGQVGAAPSGNNFLVNLPAAVGTGSGGALGFGYISKAANFALDVQLSALETLSKGKVLSNPKIMTMNNQEATITQGRTIYVPSATADKIEFKAIDALLSLKVKPRIAPGGAIFMDLDISKDEPAAASTSEGGVDVLKNTVKTSVLVNNSDTVVIGGIFKTSAGARVDSVPGLSKLPLFGRLFKKDRDVEQNTEVLVFITPRIVEFSALR